MLKGLAFLFLCFYALEGQCETYTYSYTDNCRLAYQEYMSLHIQQGREHILKEIKADPYNLMSAYIADYEDCLVLLINCNKWDFEQRISHLDDRMDIVSKGDKSSPWYRFCKAGIYLHWALVYTRFGEQYKAALNFHRSFALLRENKKLFPKFEYNNVFSGLQEAVVGSLPGNYKWLASIFGMRGNLRKGTTQLAAFVGTHDASQPLYAEAMLYYILTRFYLLSEQKETWDLLCSPQFPVKNNLLNAFAKGTIALDYRKSDDALDILKDAKQDKEYNKYPVFDYQMGVGLLTRLDTNCRGYLLSYLNKNKSNLFVKDCWQKMGLSYYMGNNSAQAEYCLGKVKSEGDSRLDADKQAARFAEKGMWPPAGLLRARLLIEGGYYHKALAILADIDVAKLSAADNLEYLFRYGRAWQEAGDNAKALQYYQSTIGKGKERHEQFAARAALQMGLIYERSGLKAKALARYRECLEMPAHDFQNSIDQQAKAGINRIEEAANPGYHG